MDADEFLAVTEEYLDEQEARFLAALRRAYRAAFAPVLSALDDATLVAAVPDPASDQVALAALRALWHVQVETVLVPLVAELYRAGALGTVLSMGPRATAGLSEAALADAVMGAVDRGALDWLATAENRLVAVGDEAWAAVRTELAAGFEAGDSIPDLAARVRDTLDASEARATTIARTEVVSASNAGSHKAASAYGPLGPTHKTWLSTLDSRTRPTHVRADGQTVPMADDFRVGGRSLTFPGDPSGPPEEVINCRCTVIYDVPDDTIESVGRQTGGVTASTEEPTMTTAIHPATGYRVPAPPRRSRMADEVPEGDAPAAPGDDPAPDEEPADETPEEDAPLVVEVPEDINVEPFSVIMAVEGRWTGDDRFLLPGSLRWDGMLPLPLTTDHVDNVPSVVGLVGRVERIPYGDGENLIVGWGLIDLGTDDRPNDAAYEVLDRYRSGALRGVSIRVDDETLGGVDPSTVADVDDEWWLYVVEDARLRALSPTPVDAFPETAVFLGPDDIDVRTVDLPPAPDNPAVALPHEEAAAAAEEHGTDEGPDDLPIVVAAVNDGPGFDLVLASGSPTAAPPDWFTDPEFGAAGDERLGVDPVTGARGCPLTVDDDGRVYGHIALWGTCHTGFPNQCITPPRSAAGYAHFLTGDYVCRDGSRVAVGRLTADTGHAPTSADAPTALAHYDHTGTAVAYVAAGEDEFGIWVAGVTAPGLDDDTLTVMRASPPSGDWRKIGAGLELLACLHVNAPGFPVPRVRVVDGLAASMQGLGRSPMTRLAAPTPNLDAAAQRVARSIGRDRAALVAALRDRVHPEKES